MTVDDGISNKCSGTHLLNFVVKCPEGWVTESRSFVVYWWNSFGRLFDFVEDLDDSIHTLPMKHVGLVSTNGRATYTH